MLARKMGLPMRLLHSWKKFQARKMTMGLRQEQKEIACSR
jgi:hypothetical protein